MTIVPIDKGGLGIQNLHEVAKVAFAVSFATSSAAIPFFENLMDVDERELLTQNSEMSGSSESLLMIKIKSAFHLDGKVAIHFQQVAKLLPNWRVLTTFKDRLQFILRNFAFDRSKGSIQHQIMDLVSVKTIKDVYNSIGVRLVKKWFQSL